MTDHIAALADRPEPSHPAPNQPEPDRASTRTLRRRARSAPAALDPITALALERVREAHPHARLLALAGWTMAELAKRVEPPVSRSRLADVFAQAEAYGRMSQAWADRLASAVGVDAQAVLALFGVAEPSRNGRPRVRRSA